MNKIKNPYISLNRFILRSPAFSRNEEYYDLIKHSSFQEAIYLASPSLYEECKKENFILNKNKLKSLYKYFKRTTERCTPFGLFAGCSTGIIADKTEIVLKNISGYKRATRFDMNFLCTLSYKIENIPSIRTELRYRKNTSLYQIDDEIRYIEYLHKGTKRIHNLVKIERTPYLDEVLTLTRQYISYKDIVNSLVKDDIEVEDATEFIESLIESQILKSELDPHVTGDNILNTIIGILKQIPAAEAIYKTLKKLENLLSDIDRNDSDTNIDRYKEIINQINNLKIPHEKNYLFQTDLFKPAVSSTISNTVIAELKELITFLQINSTYTEVKNNLNEFKQKFRERYEDAEIPLVAALDNDYGIGYGNSGNSLDFNPLIKDMTFSFGNNSKDQSFDLSKYLFDKLIENQTANPEEIVLDNKLVKGLSADWSYAPASLYLTISLSKDDSGKDFILLKGIGIHATNLLGRFCYLDSEINKIVNEIADCEKKENEEAIYASIAHLPYSRVGNILFRPNNLRDYEIPFLANSTVDMEKQIPVSDLTISVKHNRITLKSKTHNKIIIPKMDNAHNYKNEPTPIYHFLCDMQNQAEINYIGPLLNPFSNYEFIPRIRYKNIIFSPAKWRLTETIINKEKIDNIDTFTSYRKKKKIPKFVNYSEGDNVLKMDCENEFSFLILTEKIKKHKKIYISETFDNAENLIVKDEDGKNYTNEIIIPFLKTIEKK